MPTLEPPEDKRQPKEVDVYKLTDAEKAALSFEGQFELASLSRQLDQMSIEQLRSYAYKAVVQYKLYRKQTEIMLGQTWGIINPPRSGKGF